MKLADIAARGQKVIDTNESIIQTLRDLFKPKKRKLTNEELSSLNGAKFRETVTKYIKETLEDQKWRENHLTKESSLSPSYIAFIAGRQESDPVKLLKSLKEASSLATDVLNKFSENTKFRQKLCKELDSLKGIDEDIAKKADEIYLTNKSKLITNLASIYKNNGGRKINCIGFDKDNTFPYQEKNIGGKDRIVFQGYFNKPKTASYKIAGPNQSNINEYIKIIYELMDMIEDNNKKLKLNYIPYWDGSPLDYDLLHYGDEIYDSIYTSQSDYAREPAEVIRFMMSELLVDMIKAI